MGTIAVFQSCRRLTKVHSSAKATLLLVDIIIFFSIFQFFIYRKETLPSYLHKGNNQFYWLVSINEDTKYSWFRRPNLAVLVYFNKHYWNLLDVCKKPRIAQFIFLMETPCLLIWAISGLITVKNESGLLLSQSVLNYSARIAEKIILDCLSLDLTGILTIENGNQPLLSKKETWNFPSPILISKSKKSSLIFVSIFFT